MLLLSLPKEPRAMMNMLDLPISEPHQLHLAIQDSRAHKKSSSRMKSNIYIGNLVSRNVLYTGQLIGLMDNLLFLKTQFIQTCTKLLIYNLT